MWGSESEVGHQTGLAGGFATQASTRSGRPFSQPSLRRVAEKGPRGRGESDVTASGFSTSESYVSTCNVSASSVTTDGGSNGEIE